jgi:chromate transporter
MESKMKTSQAAAPSHPSFPEALRFWLRVGLVSFGGPAAQIGILHRETVERRGWISDAAFTRGLAFSTSLPGPEAQQLATWIGWRLHGTAGAIAAGGLFVAPAVIALLALSAVRAAYGTSTPALETFLYGLRIAVVAVILDAATLMATRRLRHKTDRALALGAFAAASLGWPFPAIVALAALAGLVLFARQWESGRRDRESGSETRDERQDEERISANAGARRVVAVCAVGLVLWLTPWLALALSSSAPGAPPILEDAYLFFTRAAFVTFGGAYAVLSYVIDAATGHLAWLSPAEAADGVALAETTPGPLIIVLQYIGFFAGWNAPGAWPPLLSGIVAGLLTSWATFLPSTGLVIAFAPWVERITRAPRLQGAFRGVGAAAVGVVFSFGLTYGFGVIAPGATASLDFAALLLATAALLALRLFRLGVLSIVGAGAALGIVRVLTGGLS